MTVSKRTNPQTKQTTRGLDLPETWICEHACQVTRILPGGLSVLGLYVLCDAQAFDVAALSRVLKRINAATIERHADASLLLHVDVSRGTLAAKESIEGRYWSCQVQNSSLISDLVELRAQYALDTALDLGSDKAVLSDAIEDLICHEMETRVRHCVVQGGAVPMEQLVLEHVKRGGLDHVPLRMLVPAGRHGGGPPALGMDAVHRSGTYTPKGRMEIRGNLDCRAFVFAQETLEDGLEALKADVELTLRSRLDILMEAAEMAEKAEGKKGHPLMNSMAAVGGYRPQFPSRAFMRWKLGGGCYCDYVFQGEGVHDVLERLRELVGPGVVDARSYSCVERLVDTEEGSNAKLAGSLSGSRLRSMLTRCNVMLVGTVACALLAVMYAL